MSPEKQLHVVQISDCHLGEREGDALLGMDTDQSLQAVLRQVVADGGDIDLLVVSGDLSSDGQLAAYQRLLPRLQGLAKQMVWMPGNHDDVGLMHRVAGAALMPSSLQLAGWQLLFLNSAVPGQVGGSLATAELRAVEKCLAIHMPTLIFLHHHVFAVGSQWLDEQRVENGADLLALLRGRDQVKALVCGHVHQESDISVDGVRQISVPSSCVQFAPGSVSFGLDTLNPGYRSLTLTPDGRVDTQVRRVQGETFHVDRSARGYQ